MKHHTNKFEDNFFNNRLTQATIKASERYTGNHEFDKIVEEWHKSTPKMGQFSIEENKDGIYPKQEIIQDAKWVKNFEAKNNFQETQIKISEATAAEIVFLDGVYSYEWLGENISAGSTTRYDDYKNGIDSFITYDDPDNSDNSFVIGFDITTSTDRETLGRKMDKNVDKLDNIITSQNDVNKSLHQIKYFEHPETLEKKQLFVPRIILQMNINDIKELMDRFAKKDHDITNDSIKFDIINQIAQQLDIALKIITEKYIKTEPKDPKMPWQNFLQQYKDEINKFPGLNILIKKYTTPLEYFEKLKNT